MLSRKPTQTIASFTAIGAASIMGLVAFDHFQKGTPPDQIELASMQLTISSTSTGGYTVNYSNFITSVEYLTAPDSRPLPHDGVTIPGGNSDTGAL